MKVVVLLSLLLLFVLNAQGLIITDNFSNCIKLSFFVVPTADELAWSDGVVATLSYNSSLDAPTLYNGSYLWRDAAPGNSGLDTGVTLLTSTGEYWVQDGGVERQYNTSAWYTDNYLSDRSYLFIYLFNETDRGGSINSSSSNSGTANNASSPLLPDQQLPLINSKALYCDQYWTADGQRIQSTPTSSGSSSSSSGLSSGAKVGIIVGAIVGGKLLLLSLAFLYIYLRSRRRRRSQSAAANEAGGISHHDVEPKDDTDTAAAAGPGSSTSPASSATSAAPPNDRREGLPSYFYGKPSTRFKKSTQEGSSTSTAFASVDESSSSMSVTTTQPTSSTAPQPIPTTADPRPDTEAPPAYTS